MPISEKPIAHLVWLQGRRGADDIEDYYEVALPGDKSVDGSEPFPVYAATPVDAKRHERAVPVGWQLVPKEPTFEQKVAGSQCWEPRPQDRDGTFGVAYDTYAAMLAASPPTPAAVQEPVHPDDEAVDRFAIAMKAKLAEKRAQGYGGWDRPEECTIVHLSQLLRKHIDKGDPVDVGNFSMMIHQRGGSIE